MDRKYFCLVAGLPDIFLDETKYSSTLQEFKEYLKLELHPNDFELIKLLYLPYDNKNLTRFLFEGIEDFNPLANFSPEDIQEQISRLDAILEMKDILPSYMVRFIKDFKNEEIEKTSGEWEKYLTDLYYAYILDTKNAFLHRWFRFELDLKNIQTAVNCRKHKMEIGNQLVGVNDVTDLLARNQGADFGLAIEIEDIDYIIQIAETENLLEREKRIDQYKWAYLDDHTFFHYFTIEKIIGYQLKLMMVFRWMELDRETGEKMFRGLIDEMKESYEFPEEFKI